MKQRSTTPTVSKQFITKSTLVAAAVLIAISAPIQMGQLVSADRYDEQIRAIQNEVNQYNAEAARLAAEADSLQNAIARLTAEKNAIQAEIDLNQAEYDRLVADIAANEKKLSDNKDAMGKILADLYVDDKITPLEMIASSKNIGDFLDKQEYRNSIRDSLSTTISQIKKLKKQLETDKVAVESVLQEQKSQKEVLAAKEAEQAELLRKTKSDENAYRSMSSEAQAEIKKIQEQQRAAIRTITGGGVNTAGSVGAFKWRNYSGEQGACGGGYPGSITVGNSTYGCNYGLDATVDEFALYNRECVSYTAWAAKYRFGKNVSRFNGLGHAYQWTTTGIVESMGADVNNTPAVGAIAIKGKDSVFGYGHAMVVEAVLNDGWVRVSQYNFAVNGQYSTMEIPAGSVHYVHFR